MRKKAFVFLSLLLILPFLVSAKAFAEEKTAGTSAKQAALTQEYAPDSRVKILKNYLQKYNSPLADKADVFVAEADKNNIDWRLVAAISGVESTFGHQIPTGSYNGWGWGIYGDNTHGFTSWDDGITVISKGLREDYMNKWGADNVYAIGKIYAASPTWANRVTFFMNQMDSYSKGDSIDTLSIYL